VISSLAETVPTETPRLAYFCIMFASPIPYPGNKAALLDIILENMPKHKHYVEPFCGGASVFFNKPKAELNTLNDKNEDIVNFFRVLQKEKTRIELIRRLRFTPYSRAEFRRALKIFKIGAQDEVERAWSFFILQTQGIKKLAWREAESGNGWGFRRSNSGASSFQTYAKRIDQLERFANMLRNVQLECDDGIKVIKRYDEYNTLMLVDPPYLSETVLCKDKKYYIDNLSVDYHKELLEVLDKAKSFIILCSYPNELYDALLDKGWKRIDKRRNIALLPRTRRIMKGSRKLDRKYIRIESIYLNPSLVEALERERRAPTLF